MEPDLQLRGKVLQRKSGGEVLKILKPEILKKTTTTIFGWARDSDRWTSREITLDESKRGEFETPTS
jgi:hypothetical protein